MPLGFNCVGCGRLATEIGRNGRRLCESCLADENEAEQRRLLRVETGHCGECGRAYLQVRAWQRFCTPVCRDEVLASDAAGDGADHGLVRLGGRGAALSSGTSPGSGSGNKVRRRPVLAAVLGALTARTRRRRR